MAEIYRIAHHPSFTDRMEQLSGLAALDVAGRDADVVDGAFKARKVVAEGKERDFDGERLSYSANHYDLRDCAEIKVAVFKEYTQTGKERGPSHRMIYREYDPAPDDPRPVREIIAFEHRAGGLPFAVAAAVLGRSKGRPVEALRDLPAPKPAVGRKKDPNRDVTPVRLPLPPDLAAALATSNRRPPSRSAAPSPSPTRRAVRAALLVHRDHR